MVWPIQAGLLCAIMLTAAVAHAQADADVRALSRTELFEMLVAGNPDVARAVAAAERARVQRGGALGVLDPFVDARLDLSHARTPTASGISRGIATNDRYALSATIGRTFAPGTSVAFTLSQAVNRSEFPLFTGLGFGNQTIVNGPDVETALTLQVTQPLLRGFGRQVVLVGDLLAARAVDVRELETTQIAGARALEAITAYAELRYAVEETDLRRRSLGRTERQLEIALAEMEAGQIAPIEIDLVREQIAMRREALLVADAEVARRSRQLLRLLGLDAESMLTIRASDELLAPPGVSFGSGLCDEAAANSLEIAVLRGQVALAEGRTIATADALRPNLEATAGTTQNGLDSGWASSMGQAFTFDAPTVFGGLVFTTALRNRAARAEHEVARAEVTAAGFEVDELTRSTCFQVREAVEALDLLAGRAEIAATRVDLAARGSVAEEERFVSGLSTVQRGIDSLESLEAAEIALLRIRVDAEVAWWQLQHLRGRLVESLQAASASVGRDGAGGPRADVP